MSLLKETSETPLVPEGNPHRPAGFDHLAVRGDTLELVDGVADRHTEHLVILITYHLTETAFGDEFDGVDAETGAKDAIQSGRRTTALEMAEHAATRFL